MLPEEMKRDEELRGEIRSIKEDAKNRGETLDLMIYRGKIINRCDRPPYKIFSSFGSKN